MNIQCEFLHFYDFWGVLKLQTQVIVSSDFIAAYVSQIRMFYF